MAVGKKKEREEKEKAPLFSELKGYHKVGDVVGVAYRMGGFVHIMKCNGPYHTAAVIFPFSISTCHTYSSMNKM